MSCTLPRRSAVAKDVSREPEDTKTCGSNVAAKSLLPVKFGASKDNYKPSYEFNVRSSSIGSEPRGNCKFSYSRPKVARSVSTREPRIARSELQSPESSISESLSKNDDTSINSYKKDTDSYSSKYSDSSLSRPYSKYSSDSSYSRYTPSHSNQNLLSPTSPEPPKTDRKSTRPTRRISRFLRPDFFEPKEENVYIKEKKERERETQQVLKEIRDKRKSRLRSQSRSRGENDEKKGGTPSREIESKLREQETEVTRGIVEPQLKTPNHSFERNNKTSSEPQASISNQSKGVHDYVNMPVQNYVSNNNPNVSSTDNSILKEASVNSTEGVKSAVNSSKALHDYVNVKVAENSTPTVKKESRLSRLARPKSYPTESAEKVQNKTEKCESKVEKSENKVESNDKIESNGKESKISKLKKGFGKREKPTKEAKNEANKNINEEDKAHKNKLLQTIEKKLEKFRSNNIAPTKDPEEAKALLDKKTMVDSAIKRLREQSLPRNLEPCTESGLIKRAVSVEDLAVGTQPLQASRKSVTKILGLFKKYEDSDKKKEKPVKKGKGKDEKKTKEGNEEKTNKAKNGLENVTDQSKIEGSETEKLEKRERPKSLLFDKVKHFQNTYNGAKNENLLDQDCINEKPKSKLPLTSFRRSLNLDNLPETPKFYKNHSSEGIEDNKLDRRNLKLDLSGIPSKTSAPIIIEPIASTSGTLDTEAQQDNENRNSLTTTDDSSTILSPTDDYLSCDSWSACSDFHHLNDLHSPQSHNGHVLYSGDENESVIDRIRRKSFYTRFNEKKRPRKPNLDLYGRDYGREYGKPDYSSLDRYRSPGVTRRTSFTSYIPESGTSTPPPISSTKDYKPYVRSASVLNDYVNVPGGHQKLTHSYQNVPGSHQSLVGSYQHLPGSYQTYSSRIARPSSATRGLYSDSDSHLDDILTSAIPRRHSPYAHRSTLDRGSISPVSEQYFTDRASVLQSPTTSEPI